MICKDHLERGWVHLGRDGLLRAEGGAVMSKDQKCCLQRMPLCICRELRKWMRRKCDIYN